MREFGKIYIQFWPSPDIQQLSDQGKLLAAYLLTNQHCNMTGLYRLPAGYVSDDLGWSPGTVSKGFQELSENGFITRDEDTGWLLVHKFLKWNKVENPNQGKAFVKVFDQIPDSLVLKPILADLCLAFLTHISEPFRNRLETLSKPYRNKEKEKESEERTRVTQSAVPEPALPGQEDCRVF